MACDPGTRDRLFLLFAPRKDAIEALNEPSGSPLLGGKGVMEEMSSLFFRLISLEMVRA